MRERVERTNWCDRKSHPSCFSSPAKTGLSLTTEQQLTVFLLSYAIKDGRTANYVCLLFKAYHIIFSITLGMMWQGRRRRRRRQQAKSVCQQHQPKKTQILFNFDDLNCREWIWNARTTIEGKNIIKGKRQEERVRPHPYLSMITSTLRFNDNEFSKFLENFLNNWKWTLRVKKGRLKKDEHKDFKGKCAPSSFGEIQIDAGKNQFLMNQRVNRRFSKEGNFRIRAGGEGNWKWEPIFLIQGAVN